MKPTTKILILSNTLAFLGVLIVNTLANALPLNGKSTGELSDQYPNLFTPAGLTFSIWGIIYAWLIVFIGCQLAALFKPSFATRMEPMIEKTGWLFFMTCLLNMSWMFAWHWEQVSLSVVIMTLFLGVLVQLNVRIGNGHAASGHLEKWIAHLPFGIYQGWITVAIIANITAFLVNTGWTGGSPGEATWAIIMTLTGAAVAIFILFRQNNIGHGFAVTWALFGIYLKRTSLPEIEDGGLAMVALVAALLVLAITLLRLPKWLKY